MIDDARIRRIATRALQRSDRGSHLEALHRPASPEAASFILYGVDLARCWIGIAASPYLGRRIGSSVVVAVDAETGEIAYMGYANDE